MTCGKICFLWVSVHLNLSRNYSNLTIEWSFCSNRLLVCCVEEQLSCSLIKGTERENFINITTTKTTHNLELSHGNNTRQEAHLNVYSQFNIPGVLWDYRGVARECFLCILYLLNLSARLESSRRVLWSSASKSFWLLMNSSPKHSILTAVFSKFWCSPTFCSCSVLSGKREMVWDSAWWHISIITLYTFITTYLEFI